ncbi:MAG: LD-carboxypeptidase [Acidobacteria bacterium]|nr:MAG: LD-carboxypeptidase [Acidobacteriota bacterium]
MTAERSSLFRPPVLQRGDTVGIVAPAGPVNRKEFEAGVLALQQIGLVPVFSESIFERERYFAGGIRRRVDELHEMFRLPEVKAIICTRGGYGSNYLLPHLDLSLIAKNPKIFCGYSDLTTLLTYFHDELSLIGFHGPMLAKDFARPEGVHLKSFSFASSGQPQWTITNSDSPAMEAICPGEAEGKLYGGCLSLLVASLGTPYEIRTEETILFLEDLGEWPYRIDRMLMQLRYAGKLEKVRGIVFGEMLECSPPASAGYTLQEAIAHILGDLNVPVAFGLRSGHVSAENITLPIGVRARLIVAESATLEILEAATTPRSETTRAG